MIHRIVLIILLYVLYRSIKSWYLSSFSKGRSDLKDNSNRGHAQIEGEMIQDPYCKVYFSKNEGVRLEHEGKTYAFCSAKCRDAFVSSKK